MPSLREALGEQAFAQLLSIVEAAKRQAWQDGYDLGTKNGRPLLSEASLATLRGVWKSRTIRVGGLLAAAAAALADPELQAWVREYLGQYSYTVMLGAASAATIALRLVTSVSLAAKGGAPDPSPEKETS